MTKKYTIICNHCQKEIQPENGVGIHFIGNESARVRPMRDCENHLCTQCAKGYYEALKDVF